MPSLEDIPTLPPKTTPSGSDLVALHDQTEVGNSRTKRATCLSLTTASLIALPGPFADDPEASSEGVAIGYPYKTAAGGLAFRLS